MAELKVRAVGGSTWTNLPEPDYNGGLTWSIQDVDASTSGRDQSGYMHRDRVAIKRKISCTWTNRESTDINAILNSAIKNVFFELSYFDYETNSQKTGVFYCGDRTAPVYSIVMGSAHNKRIIGSFTANFVER